MHIYARILSHNRIRLLLAVKLGKTSNQTQGMMVEKHLLNLASLVKINDPNSRNSFVMAL